MFLILSRMVVLWASENAATRNLVSGCCLLRSVAALNRVSKFIATSWFREPGRSPITNPGFDFSSVIKSSSSFWFRI